MTSSSMGCANTGVAVTDTTVAMAMESLVLNIITSIYFYRRRLRGGLWLQKTICDMARDFHLEKFAILGGCLGLL
jgi:hypothetical protein